MNRHFSPFAGTIKRARRLAAQKSRLHRSAYRCLVLLAHLEFIAQHVVRTITALGYRWERQAKQWSQTHPYSLLAAFPILGDPKSFPVPPKAGLREAVRDALKGSWTLIGVAIAPWTIAYAQFQSLFFSLTKDQIIAEVGQTAFEEVSAWLEISTWFFPVVAYFGIIAVSLACVLVHRAEIAITHLSWRAKPRVGFRFHLTQVASMALYLGLPVQAVAWIINHRSFAEPWIHAIAGSPLILIPGGIWLIGHRLYQRRRESYRRTLYGNSRRALLASLLTTAPLLGMFLIWKMGLR